MMGRSRNTRSTGADRGGDGDGDGAPTGVRAAGDASPTESGGAPGEQVQLDAVWQQWDAGRGSADTGTDTGTAADRQHDDGGAARPGVAGEVGDATDDNSSRTSGADDTGGDGDGGGAPLGDTVDGVRGEEAVMGDLLRDVGTAGEMVTQHTAGVGASAGAGADAGAENGAGGGWFAETELTNNYVDITHLPAHDASEDGASAEHMVVVEAADSDEEMYVTLYGQEYGRDSSMERGPVGDEFGVPPGYARYGRKTVAAATALDLLDAADADVDAERVGAPRVKAVLRKDAAAESWVAVEGVPGAEWAHADAAALQNVARDEFCDVVAAHLLCGNTDLHAGNMLVTDDGSIWVPDLDHAAAAPRDAAAVLDRPVEMLRNAPSADGLPRGIDDDRVKREVLQRAERFAERLVEEHGGVDGVADVIRERMRAVSGGDFDADREASNIAQNIRRAAPEHISSDEFTDADDY